MDILDIAIRNARIDAVARAKRLQAKPRGKDRTRGARAQAANVRDGLDRPSAWRCSHSRHVSFGVLDPARFIAKKPLVGILKH